MWKMQFHLNTKGKKCNNNETEKWEMGVRGVCMYMCVCFFVSLVIEHCSTVSNFEFEMR